MGTVDKSTHHFTCPSCGASETVSVYESGSSYGSSWDDAPDADKFDVNWKPNRYGEPRPMSIKCKACGSEGKDDMKHGV
jgi:hypothetical protein